MKKQPNTKQSHKKSSVTITLTENQLSTLREGIEDALVCVENWDEPTESEKCASKNLRKARGFLAGAVAKTKG